jgi:hypothetical protein
VKARPAPSSDLRKYMQGAIICYCSCLRSFGSAKLIEKFDDRGVFETSILSSLVFEDMIQRRQKANPMRDKQRLGGAIPHKKPP